MMAGPWPKSKINIIAGGRSVNKCITAKVRVLTIALGVIIVTLHPLRPMGGMDGYDYRN